MVGACQIEDARVFQPYWEGTPKMSPRQYLSSWNNYLIKTRLFDNLTTRLIITVKSKAQGAGAGSVAHYRAKLSEPQLGTIEFN